MSQYSQYRVWCVTENKNVETTGFQQSVQTVCPNDITHTIDPSKTTTIDKLDNTFAVDLDGNAMVSSQPRLGSALTIITHNFSDPCTWYTNSVQVTDEIATNSGDNLTYNLANSNIIDTDHGRITFDSKMDPKYLVVVKKDNIVQTTGYVIDYENGSVIFSSAIVGTIKVSYFYATDSEFRVQANPGKKIKMVNIELQFSNNIKMAGVCEAHFEEWGYDPNNLPNKMLYKNTKYKNMRNIIDESNNSFSKTIPPIDNITNPVEIYVWNYSASRLIRSSEGGELRIKIYHNATNSYNQPITDTAGNKLEVATIAMYCISEYE